MAATTPKPRNTPTPAEPDGPTEEETPTGDTTTAPADPIERPLRTTATPTRVTTRTGETGTIISTDPITGQHQVALDFGGRGWYTPTTLTPAP